MSESLVTSSCRASARPPASRIRRAVSSARSATKSVAMTMAPSRPMISAPPRPMPEPAAVTMATRSLRIMLYSLSSSLGSPGRALAPQQQLRAEQHDQREHHDGGADSVDLRRHAAPDGGEDVDRQGIERPGNEIGDHVIVEAEGEAEQEAGQDRGHELRQ